MQNKGIVKLSNPLGDIISANTVMTDADSIRPNIKLNPKSNKSIIL